MVARTSAKDIAAKTDPAEQREKLAATLAQVLGQMGVSVDSTVLAQRLEKVDVAGGDSEGIIAAVGAYLKDGAGMAAEQVQQVVEQAPAALQQILPTIGVVVKKDADGEVDGDGEAEKEAEERRKKTVWLEGLEEVKAWKAGMPLSAGPRAVRAVGDFEEVGAKL